MKNITLESLGTCTKCKRPAVGAIIIPWGSIKNRKPICAFHYAEWVATND